MLVEYMKQDSRAEVTLVGYEDQRELSERDRNLPESRVGVVRRALVAAGVRPWRFVEPPAPWGNHRNVLCQEDTDICLERNRRVEIFLKQRL
jgi:outer membrane protein OmpA-like peptidoglycan-associated protein